MKRSNYYKCFIIAFMLFFAFNCSIVDPDDESEDIKSPTVGTSIVVSDLTIDSMTITWGASKDNQSSVADLQYKVVISEDSTLIDSVTEVKALSDDSVVADWTKALTTTELSGLDEFTLYYIRVAVKDTNENVSLYPMGYAETTMAGAPIVSAESINITDNQDTQVTINWLDATDVLTPQNSLKYTIAISNNKADIDTVSKMLVVTGDNLLAANQIDINSIDATGLTAGTKYWVSVMVTDGDDKSSLYLPVAVETTKFYSLGTSGSEAGVSYCRIGSANYRFNPVAATENGFVLKGGGSFVYKTTEWMSERAGGKGTAGDFVELTTGSTTQWTTLYNAGQGWNSVISLQIDTADKANSMFVYEILRNAEAVFIMGGDQTEYYTLWNDTKLQEALNYLISTKKVPIGGTSAGMAILSEYSYLPNNSGVKSSDALTNIYHAYIAESTIKKSLFKDSLPVFMTNFITDTHFNARDRMGRFLAFVARLIVQHEIPFADAHGIACDESTAVCIDKDGIGSVYSVSDGGVYFVTGGNDTIVNKPFDWRSINCYKIIGTTDGSREFDVANWTADTGVTGIDLFTIDVINGVLDYDEPFVEDGRSTGVDLSADTLKTDLSIGANGTSRWVKFTADTTQTLYFWIKDKYNYSGSAPTWANDITFYNGLNYNALTVSRSNTSLIVVSGDSYYMDSSSSRSVPLYFYFNATAGKTYYIKLLNRGTGSTGGNASVKISTSLPTNWN